MIKKIAVWLFIIRIFSFSAAAFAQEQPILFSDVKTGTPWFTAVNFLKENGYIQDNSNNTFKPKKKIQRDEALEMIFKITGLNADDAGGVLNAEKPFLDVSEKNKLFKIIKKAKELGIITGVKNGKYFRPNKSLNLAETLRMLFKSAHINTEEIQDGIPNGIAQDAWYAKDMAYAVSREMLTQQQNGIVFPPFEKLKRGEAAVLLYRFLKNKSGSSFGYASWYGDGLAKTKLYTGFEYVEKNLTAAHKTLPFGTIVRVTNMYNGKQVDVVINDRGPYVIGRIIDLSKTAFSALESPSIGVIQVEIKPL